MRSEGEIAALLRETGALLEGHFQLASGRHSPVYIEKFRLLQHPRHTESVCRLIAERFRAEAPEVVAGPTTGGIILSYEVARQLGVRGIFAERAEGGRVFGRGFSLAPGERVLVVDDVLTTGGSVQDVLRLVRSAGGLPVGVGVLVDRTGGRVALGVPLFACLTLDLPAYDPGDCPLCREAVPLKLT